MHQLFDPLCIKKPLKQSLDNLFNEKLKNDIALLIFIVKFDFRFFLYLVIIIHAVKFY
jgi:hypothetical protein